MITDHPTFSGLQRHALRLLLALAVLAPGSALSGDDAKAPAELKPKPKTEAEPQPNLLSPDILKKVRAKVDYNRIFSELAPFFSTTEPWESAATMAVPEGDRLNLIFSLKEKEQKVFAENVVHAQVGGLRPKSNKLGLTATISIYELVDGAKGPAMIDGLTSILNANRKKLDDSKELKVIDFQGTNVPDKTFQLIKYHTYGIDPMTGKASDVAKFQVMRAAAGNIVIDAIVMNAAVPKNKLLDAMKSIVTNHQASIGVPEFKKPAGGK